MPLSIIHSSSSPLSGRWWSFSLLPRAAAADCPLFFPPSLTHFVFISMHSSVLCSYGAIDPKKASSLLSSSSQIIIIIVVGSSGAIWQQCQRRTAAPAAFSFASHTDRVRPTPSGKEKERETGRHSHTHAHAHLLPPSSVFGIVVGAHIHTSKQAGRQQTKVT